MPRCVEFLCVFLLYQPLVNNYELLEDNQFLDRKHIALLIEDSPRNFRNVLNFVQSVSSEDHLNDTDLWLITFNSSGVSSIWEKSLDNVDKFYKNLQFLASQNGLETDLSSNKSLPMFATLHTAQLLPKNSDIIVFTSSFVNTDTGLENAVLKSILSKNITVYTVKDNEHKTPDLLQNIREYSGGKVIKLNLGPKHEDYKYITYPTTRNVSLVLFKKNLLNDNELAFPIDHDVSGIHITVRPSAYTNGLLISPSGYKFSFSSKIKSNSIRYSQDSVFENENGSFDIHLNFSTSGKPTIGMWRLKLDNLKEFYNVSVYVFTNIATEAQIHDMSEGVNNVENVPKDVMKLGVTGNISHITDISVLDCNGELVLGNLSYKFDNKLLKYVTENGDNVPDIENKEVNVEMINKLQRTQPFYALIRGKDVKGNVFQRLSFIHGKSDIYPQQSIVVEVALGSELIISPGRKAEVYFEVTNYGSNEQYVSFTCSDSKYSLRGLSIYRKNLNPQESVLATLFLNPTFGTYQDEITFSVATGSQFVQKKVLVDIGLTMTDFNLPEISHKYLSDCTGILAAQCSKSSWTIEITAIDQESGLLQLNTIPKGIFFPHGYTSGTRDSVTGHYSQSCCNPDLQISAVDRMNNRRSYNVNAYHARWSPGAIAAIVLGILLFIILVAVITFFIVKKYKTKESYDLPTYRGGGI